MVVVIVTVTVPAVDGVSGKREGKVVVAAIDSASEAQAKVEARASKGQLAQVEGVGFQRTVCYW